MANRVLLGLGMALLVAFSGVVVWMYFGKGNLITDCVVVLFAVLSLIALVVIVTRRATTLETTSPRSPRQELQ